MSILKGDAAVNRVLVRLKNAGFYEGAIDAAWGPLADGALDRLIAQAGVGVELAAPEVGGGGDPPLAWGAKVSRVFRERVRWIGNDLGVPADDVMDCIGWESAGTFAPDIVNMAGSGATGLIQFMPLTAISLGTTTTALARMTAEDQLNYVYKYFRPFKGRLRNLGDLYMAILWPAGVGKPDAFVLWEKGKRPTTYRQNAGLDVNKDGTITRGEALAKVRKNAELGRRQGAYWPGA